MQEEHRTPETKGAAARAQAMSRALADAARRARFSTRSKQRLSAGGFQARRGERRIRLLAALSFVLMVIITIMVLAYARALGTEDLA